MANNIRQKLKKLRRGEITAILRERIMDRQFSPGFKLVEQDLARELGISRPILREILSDLETQGLVERHPHRGAVVKRVDSESIFETLEIREVLEGLAARLAAVKTRPEDWKDLEEEFGETCERFVANLEFENYLALITKFRKRMVEAAQNEELSKLIDSIYSKIRMIQRRVIILPGRIQKGMEEHRRVLKAIMEGNPEQAQKAKCDNIESAREYLKKYQKWVL